MRSVRLYRYGWGDTGYRGQMGPRAKYRVGLLFNPNGVWIGAHWSDTNRRLCVNLLPCLTLWLVLDGGREP